MNIVLGAGVAGLIWAYYNKDYFVLSDQVGGQMFSYFDLGPRYLHNKSEAVTRFLRNLNLPIHKRTIRVGYIDDSGWVENPDISFRRKYYMKSRGLKDEYGFEPTVLNTNINEFEVCDVDFRQLIVKLFENVTERVYVGKIESINLKERLIVCDTGLRIKKFDNLVSTIPLNIFCKVSGINMKLEASSMAYCLLSDTFFDLKQFDFVYDNRTTTSFHRMTKCRQGIVCDLLESRIQEFIETCSQFLSLPLEQAMKIVKNSQIISLDKDFQLEDKSIKFIGRYGTWSRRWKTETVIEESQKNLF